MVVVSENVGGNMHDAAQWCNKYNLGKYLRQMDYVGSSTIVILVMTEKDHDLYQKGMKTLASKPWKMKDTP